MQFKDWCHAGMLLAGMASWSWSQTNVSEEDYGKTIAWRHSYGKAAKEAVDKGQPLLIEFTATWCGACQQMQQLTFRDPRVVSYVQTAFVPLVIDADQHSDLVRGFRIESFPATLVVGPDLKILKRLNGFQSASSLLPDLEKVLREKFAAREIIQPVSADRPSNASQRAFDGFCLVSILDDHKVRRGNGQFTTTFRDQEVCFHSEQHLQKFLANPDRYWPVANGKCLVSEEDAVGDPRLGVTWRGKLWLFSDKESQQRFIQSPRKYVSGGM